MKKYLMALCAFYAGAAIAGLGDPYTYTLTKPPVVQIPPTPFDLPVPTRPTIAPSVGMEVQEPFNARLDSLRIKSKKIRVLNAPGIENLPVLCAVRIIKDICQANMLRILTDQAELIQSPLDRLTPSSYVAVGSFTSYFDLSIMGNTPCTVDVSCEYIVP
ncbi:MAG: hypothetical protein WC748_04525 [Legionellales bacterium]|jgi:hypothetical protein